MKRSAKEVPLKKGKRMVPESEDMKARAKKEWDKLSKAMKDKYKTRLEAEKHLKAYLKITGEKGDYVPISEYGKFVKTEIETGRIKKCDNKFFYEIFQKWIKGGKELTGH
eukprot:TRINITY_DN2065_c0_g3_i5.p4 TRINITY_DN2065_c0_g3~~TRINITY_DN2065_c0_g3_i5.p4  ORF type:complete len:110 (+),score=36.97 TRINITY_DN2065_c0_g3_i5:813-1142(+)